MEKNSITKPVITFPVWKKLSIGTVKDLNKMFYDRSFVMYGLDLNSLNRWNFRVLPFPATIDLVMISVSEFYPKGAYLMDVYQEALKHGLKLCPREVGIQLRLQYKNQPLGESLIIASEAFRSIAYEKSIFYIAHSKVNNKLILQSAPGYSDYYCTSDQLIVFRS